MYHYVSYFIMALMLYHAYLTVRRKRARFSVYDLIIIN